MVNGNRWVLKSKLQGDAPNPGVVGTAAGGWVFSLFGCQGVTGFNLQNLLIAFVGAVIVLAEFNLIFRRK